MSVADLSDAKRELLRRRLRARLAHDPIPRRPEGVEPPLSPAQEPLWFMERFTPGTTTYTLVIAVRLREPLDEDRLLRALAALPVRHEGLRHRFPETEEGRPAVHVVDTTEVPLNRTTAVTDEEAIALIGAETAVPLDLARGPLLKCVVVSKGEDEHIVALLVHHIVADGQSLNLLMRDLLALSRGEEPPAPAVRFGDVALWQRERSPDRELDYWRGELAGLPRLELLTDRPRPALQTLDGATHVRSLAPDLVDGIASLGREHGATTFMTLLAAYQVLLSRLTGQDDFAVGVPVAGRSRPEFEDVVGMFVNVLAIRARLDGEPTFAELLARTRDTVLAAVDHEQLPFAQLVDALGVPRDTSRPPLIDTICSMHEATPGGGTETLTLAPTSARHDVELYTVPTPEGGLLCAFTYRPELFGESTVARMAGQFVDLLRAIVDDPHVPIGRLPLTGDDALIAGWNATGADYPDAATLHGLIEEQVARTPEAVAVTFAGQSWTYRQLDERANRIAHRLAGLGVEPGGLVAVCAERSFDLVAALLGVLKTGAAYVPLDPGYPADRLAFMLSDSGAPVVLTQQDLAERLVTGGAVILPLDLDAVWDGLPATTPEVRGGPGTAAYMIYTSGSTGRPKGVPNSHRGIVNRLDWMQKRFRLTGADVVLQKTPAGFDVSVWEFFWPLLTGARLVLAEPEGHRDPAYLRDLINAERVTVLHFVPSMLSAFLDEEGVETCTSPRVIVCSGEELPVDLAERCLRTLPAELHNLYGPTEAAVDVSAWRCTLPALAGRARVPIGSPIQNITLHVLDRHGEPVPVGVPGELSIGGVGVALGYHARPELTAERFAGGRYRTGDAARWLPDGTIEFLGRLDGQVKLRGLRIELGEIEAVLREKAGVRDAAVIVREDLPGGPRLVAYLTGDAVPEAAQVRAAIRGTLPEYMLPSMFVPLDALPLTPNGKLDRAALPVPQVQADVPYAEPETETERAVAAVWADVLAAERIGADDDFFDLGGHSLLAVQVVAKLRRALPAGSAQVGLVDIFTYRTVRELAAYAGSGEDGPRPLLQRLTPARTASVTYVCVPYGSGSAVVYQPLADALPADQALYALAIPGHDVGLDEEPMEFAELAARATEEILAIEGPLVIYGHCGVGAALAVELATRVEAVGRAVDAVYTGAIFPFARPRGLMRALSRIGEFDRLRSSQTDINRLKARGVDLEELDPGVADRIVRTMRHDSKAAEKYFTELFDAPDRPRLCAPIISVVGERDPATDFYAERYREWGFLTDVTALVVLDEGGHYFLRYRAEELAAALRTHTHMEVSDRSGNPSWWVHAVSRGSAPPGSDKQGVRPSMGRFLTISAGQQLSMIGSALTGWALPLTVLMDSGSIGQFSMLAVLNLAGLLISPLAGAIVDRGDRRRVMLFADCASAGIQAVLAGLLLFGDVQIWQIYLLIVSLSVAASFQRLAYQSAVPQLVPKHYLGHAIGVTQMTNGVAQLVVPLVAAGLLAWIGLGGIVAIDMASYAFAIVTVLLVRFPDTLPWRPREPLSTEIAKGFTYTWHDRGLRSTLVFFAVLNVFLSPLLLLVSPLVLSFATLKDVSVISLVSGLGVMLGGLTMSLWGGPRRGRFRGVLTFAVAIAAGGVVTGLAPSLVVVGVGAFALTYFLTLMNGIYVTIVQIKVPARFHGRVFALNTLVAWSTLPIGIGLVAPLGAALFDPMLAPGGALASTVGALIGVGPGRGIAFLYLVCALGMILVAAGALRVRRLARLDTEMPDALPDDLVGVEAIQRRVAA
ncbi:non-ribosomal peptide synthetase/MFS transporter [Microbispora bryophytorum]|uniref:Amino acid adenylation domain-containing protein n=1 Tax=Microbispora bryophytorum subsp. camponoti TaxID=1677852 RepID=A0ABR8LER4_9ACTN|nr:non-ribosomal peptide synthetase/MFS transporter [Microbispora camponoti]MBD3147301.1 amino acid adenylation domain-containing protein [Microbispora camponoti]